MTKVLIDLTTIRENPEYTGEWINGHIEPTRTSISIEASFPQFGSKEEQEYKDMGFAVTAFSESYADRGNPKIIVNMEWMGGTMSEEVEKHIMGLNDLHYDVRTDYMHVDHKPYMLPELLYDYEPHERVECYCCPCCDCLCTEPETEYETLKEALTRRDDES